MIPRRRPTLVHGFLKNFLGSFLKRDILNGQDIRKFEVGFAKYIGTKYALTTSSGREGMKLILESLNLKEGSEIIMPAYTLTDLAKIIIDLGLKPVFVDIKKDTLNIDESQIKEKITPKSKVILATHLFGRACNISSILKIAKDNQIEVIEDCAHALGAEFEGKKLGSFGKAAFFSFETPKPVNCFGGGMFTTNDSEIIKITSNRIKDFNFSYRKLLWGIFNHYIESLLTNKEIFSLFSRFLRLKFFKNLIKKGYRKLHKSSTSEKTRFSNLQAKIGLEQLKKIDKTNGARVAIARLYQRFFSSNKKIELPLSIGSKQHIYYFYIIKTKKAEELSKKLYRLGLDVGYGEDIVENCGFKIAREHFPNTEESIKTVLQIPMGVGLTKKNIWQISNCINNTSES